MLANKRVRDLRRRSVFRLTDIGGRSSGTTTFPTSENNVEITTVVGVNTKRAFAKLDREMGRRYRVVGR